MPYLLDDVKIADSPRPYADWPQATIIGGTKLPSFRLWATSGEHVGVSAGGQDEPTAIINQVRYSVRMDLHPYGGQWGLAREKPDVPSSTWHAIIARRADSYGDASDAARRFLRDRVVPALVELIDSPEFAPILSAARAYRRAYEIERAEKNLTAADAALREAQVAVKAAYALPEK